MTIFYSPSRKGFFDEAIHGAVEIDVTDEKELAKSLLKAGENEEKRKKLLDSPPTKRAANPDSLVPADAIEITSEEHAALLAELSDGKVIALDGEGRPVAVERGVPIEEQLAAIRRRRDRELARTDWTQAPDAAAALSAAKRTLWAEHRQALRDLPAAVEKALKAGREPPEFPQAPDAKK